MKCVLTPLQPHERPAVTIREDKAGNILWTGLREVVVPTSADVMQNLFDGSQIRQTGQTAMNDQSSRSHAIFSLTLTQKHYTGTLKTPTNSPPTTHSAAFTTPSRIAHRQSMPLVGLQGTPGSASRVTSPTPSGQGTRPNTPGSATLRPRPSSVALSAAASRSGTSNGEAASSEWTTVISKFHWVDLAGSERVSEGVYTRRLPADSDTFSSSEHPLSVTERKRASPLTLVFLRSVM